MIIQYVLWSRVGQTLTRKSGYARLTTGALAHAVRTWRNEQGVMMRVEIANSETWGQKCSEPIQFRCQKVLLRTYISELNQYRTSIGGSIRSVRTYLLYQIKMACLRAVFVAEVQN